ncbi:hypothetical protein Tther_00283 [Tepidimonas thermarum]|uniref:Uncharacterized protein n=1 Tax=Tepidimonas thermarum TaxID=335431 RepID=A0A554X7G2_9BURK|nr:hypothetical protein [Tepidimonas thermarum]TSE31773.1 hypothetical protein Tther_00283 [Tepidimonas thermarum]
MRALDPSPETPRLWALFALGALALHFPLLGVWVFWAERAGAAAPFVVALFGVWAALIGALAWMMERTPD